MKHKPRPAIPMEKQNGWAPKLGRVESLGLSKVGQTVLARSMESQIWHQPVGSVGGGFKKRTIASAHLDARDFCFSLYILVLELRGGESE